MQLIVGKRRIVDGKPASVRDLVEWEEERSRRQQLLTALVLPNETTCWTFDTSDAIKLNTHTHTDRPTETCKRTNFLSPSLYNGLAFKIAVEHLNEPRADFEWITSICAPNTKSTNIDRIMKGKNARESGKDLWQNCWSTLMSARRPKKRFAIMDYVTFAENHG